MHVPAAFRTQMSGCEAEFRQEAAQKTVKREAHLALQRQVTAPGDRCQDARTELLEAPAAQRRAAVELQRAVASGAQAAAFIEPELPLRYCEVLPACLLSWWPLT